MNAYHRLRPNTHIESCECAAVEELLLVDIMTDNPLHCGRCRKQVDPERLQLTVEETELVAQWFSAASALYKLWLDSGEYEDFARRCLLDPQGQVNRVGLEVARRLGHTVPTRLWFFHDTDDGVPAQCPFCGRTLDTEVKWGTGRCSVCPVQL